MIINQVVGGGGLKTPSNGKELTGVSFASSLQKGDFVTTSSGQLAMPGVGVDFRPGNANEDYHTSSNCYFLYNNTKYPSLGSCWLTPTTGFGICKVEGTSKPYTQTVLFYKSTFTDKMTVEWSATPVLSLSLENSCGTGILGLAPVDDEYFLLVYSTGVNNYYTVDANQWAIRTLKWDGTQLVQTSNWIGDKDSIYLPLSWTAGAGAIKGSYLYHSSNGNVYLCLCSYFPDGENSQSSWSSARKFYLFTLSNTGVVQSFHQAYFDVPSLGYDFNRITMGVDEKNDKVYICMYYYGGTHLGTFISSYDIKTKTMTNMGYNDKDTNPKTLTQGRLFYIKDKFLYRFFKGTDSNFYFGVYNYTPSTTLDLNSPVASISVTSPDGVNSVECYGIYIEDNEHIYCLMANFESYNSGTTGTIKTGGAIYLYQYSFDGTQITQVGAPLLLCETARFVDSILVNTKKINDALVLNSYYLNTKFHFISPETPSVLGIKKNDTTAIVVAKE